MDISDGLQIGSPVKTLDADAFTDGDVVCEGDREYLIRLTSAEPHPKYGPQVQVDVTPLLDDRSHGLSESTTTDDEQSAIKDAVATLIWTLEGYEQGERDAEYFRERDSMNADYARSR